MSDNPAKHVSMENNPIDRATAVAQQLADDICAAKLRDGFSAVLTRDDIFYIALKALDVYTEVRLVREAVKAACLTAYHDCKYPACECELIKQVQNACAAFTAAQLAGAGEQEITARHSLVEENGRNHIGEAHLHVAHKDRGGLLSTISALRARVAELEAMLCEAEGPVVYHAAKGCEMCKDFLPELRAVILYRSAIPPHERPQHD